jgi:hypothetical protein
MIIIDSVNKEDVLKIKEYSKTISFNTPANHVELHNDLFDKYGAKFDIHTRGEMPKDILSVFSNAGKKIYEIVSSVEGIDYHPPMFSKNYIARYQPGVGQSPAYNNNRPDKTYKAYVFWDDLDESANAIFSERSISIKPKSGDLIIFEEVFINSFGFSPAETDTLHISEFWLSPIGSVPFENVDYPAINWNDWEIKGF